MGHLYVHYTLDGVITHLRESTIANKYKKATLVLYTSTIQARPDSGLRLSNRKFLRSE